MAEEQAQEQEQEPKQKGPLLKIILLVVGILLLLVITIVGTLFATGFFSKKPAVADAEAALAQAEKGQDGKDDKKGAEDSGPKKKPIPAEKETRFEKSYMELDDKKPLVANVSGSRKVMQASLSLMTHYDDRVFQNVEKHRTALRSAALDVLRQVTEADLARPDFRTEILAKLRDRINQELERLEGFGGIEEVFFIEFVFQ